VRAAAKRLSLQQHRWQSDAADGFQHQMNELSFPHLATCYGYQEQQQQHQQARPSTILER